MDIGIAKKERRHVSDGLSHVVADTMILAIKTLNYHWNVTGKQFGPLHDLFHDQYESLLEGADELAERIRALGFCAPGSFSEFSTLTAIKEETGHPDSWEMVECLMNDHEVLAKRCKEVMATCESMGDEATADLMVQRMQGHGKMAWMLRSYIEE